MADPRTRVFVCHPDDRAAVEQTLSRAEFGVDWPYEVHVDQLGHVERGKVVMVHKVAAPGVIDGAAEAVLVAHQAHRNASCLCGWSELGKSHPGHQVAMLREVGLLADEECCQEAG